MSKLYISADIEGVAGVVTNRQAARDMTDYAQGRNWMTNEVLAACEAARSEGIEKIVISDSHGGGDNLLIDKLPDYVEIVRSWPRELMMVQGVECDDFVGAAFIGYHAGSTALSGVLAHVFTGEILELRLNGDVMSETTFNAAVCGHFGVPLIMVSGDDVYNQHVRDSLGEIETATVKWAHGGQSARNLTPQVACQKIGEAMRTALGRMSEFQPYRIEGPITLEIKTGSQTKAELCSYIPTVERTGSHDIRLVVDDMIAASRFINLYIHIPTNI